MLNRRFAGQRRPAALSDAGNHSMPATGPAGRTTTREIVTALPLGGRKDNLPAEVTRFIGRRRELPAITGAVGRPRLVTLRGTGGVGNARVPLRAGSVLPGGSADGCGLVQLSPLDEPGLLAATVSETLGLPSE